MNEFDHYPEIIIRSSVPTDKERQFLASLIAQKRRGRAFTVKQCDWLGAIVRRFKREVMRDDGQVVE
jgi:hypothetical protein